MKFDLRKFVPESLKRLIRCAQGKKFGNSSYLRESISHADIGEAGPLITNVFSKIKDVPGWFNIDDCGHFFLVLTHQSAMGIKGNMLEIGSYHGRSTALMAKCLQSEEKIVVCDAFESETEDKYSNKPSPENLIFNIMRLNPEINKDNIVIHKCLSNNIHLAAEEMFRFVHIDGGHSAEQAYYDLKLCSKHVIPKGIIVMDDYHHKQFPGVTEGTDRFLRENSEFIILADLNRHGALGRKLYLIKQ